MTKIKRDSSLSLSDKKKQFQTIKHNEAVFFFRRPTPLKPSLFWVIVFVPFYRTDVTKSRLETEMAEIFLKLLLADWGKFLYPFLELSSLFYFDDLFDHTPRIWKNHIFLIGLDRRTSARKRKQFYTPLVGLGDCRLRCIQIGNLC